MFLVHKVRGGARSSLNKYGLYLALLKGLLMQFVKKIMIFAKVFVTRLFYSISDLQYFMYIFYMVSCVYGNLM